MQKLAPAESPIHDLIRKRWSPRAFADKPVPADVLRSLFEAARWAPSSNNEQPWAYLVATKDDKENFARSRARRCQAHVLEEQRSEPQRSLRSRGSNSPSLR